MPLSQWFSLQVMKEKVCAPSTIAAAAVHLILRPIIGRTCSVGALSQSASVSACFAFIPFPPATIFQLIRFAPVIPSMRAAFDHTELSLAAKSAAVHEL
jgi:hypothetical protein